MQHVSTKIVNLTLSQSRNKVTPTTSYAELINELIKKNLLYNEIYDLDHNITDVLYTDPEITPEDINNMFILSSDVTHGIFEDKCGF